MSRTSAEFKSEALRAALRAAIAGRTRELEDLLARHGGLPGRPNLKLAAAFGGELAALPGSLAALLDRFGGDDSAPNDPRAYLPIAAAHGWMQRARAGHEVESAWSALRMLAADPRAPVRIGTRAALHDAAQRDSGADTLITRATSWLDDDQDRELAWGAAALVIETLSDPQVQGVVRDHEALLSYLSRVMEGVVSAPRAAARSEGRRRVLASLPLALARVVAFVRTQDRGFEWFRGECSAASHPDLRAALSKALIQLAQDARSPGAAVIAELRKTLEASAKPIRDAARVRPGHGRGRRSRAVR
jgi:hypothetical protein